MATGRTVSKHTRVYFDGYDVSGMARAIGPLEITFDEAELTTFTDAVKGYLPNHPQINIGTLNTVFDNTATTGIHTVGITAGTERVVTAAIGIRGAPAIGDPVFAGQFTQSGYREVGEGPVLIEIPFAGWAADATHRAYPIAWGQLLHTNVSAAAANASGTGVLSHTGAATTRGGYMVYHVTAATVGAGKTATIKVQHSPDEVDANYVDLGGCTTGVIDVSTAPISGMLATTTPTTTVDKYLRWQIVLGTAASVSFVLSFIRGI